MPVYIFGIHAVTRSSTTICDVISVFTNVEFQIGIVMPGVAAIGSGVGLALCIHAHINTIAGNILGNRFKAHSAILASDAQFILQSLCIKVREIAIQLYLIHGANMRIQAYTGGVCIVLLRNGGGIASG